MSVRAKSKRCRKRGQGTVEYILLTSVVLVAALAFMGPVTDGLGKFLGTYTKSATTSAYEGGKQNRNNYYQDSGSPGNAQVVVH